MEFNEFKDRAYFFQYVNKGPYPDEEEKMKLYSWLLYPSEAADDTPCVDLGRRRVNKTETHKEHKSPRHLR
ncbi:hypothetical protein GQX54_12865 [Staphylococcus aureus]|nr:hypothetical protein [Staphylococcus aureus]